MNFVNEINIGFTIPKEEFNEIQSYDRSYHITWLTEIEQKEIKKQKPQRIIFQLEDTDKFIERKLCEIREFMGMTVFSWKFIENEAMMVELTEC